MNGWIMAAQMLSALILIVGLHELGHLVAAKAFGMRVEQYSIGFPPHFFSFKWKGTKYALGMIPLGGYAKIAGMVDESLQKGTSKAPEPWEFRAKPAWQRLIVMLGGIIFNLITGILVFSLMVFTKGEVYLPAKEVKKHGIVAHELGQSIGLQTGDKILRINGRGYERFSDLYHPAFLIEKDARYTILRDNQEIDIRLPERFIESFAARDKAKPFIEARLPFEVKTVLPNSEAEKGGLRAEDRFVTIASDSIRYYDELKATLKRYAGSRIQARIKRKGEEAPLDLTFQVSGTGTLGFMIQPMVAYKQVHYSALRSLQKGTSRAFSTVWLNAKGIAKVITGKLSASKSLTGPIGIAQMFGSEWKAARFWYLVGLISIVLALFNLLPIPALDGGHALICIYEMITRKKPTFKFLYYTQIAGMTILILLTVYILFNDILKLI